MSAVRITATDLDNPADTMSHEIDGDDYVLVGVGRCAEYSVQVHFRKDGTQTHVITIRNVMRRGGGS